MWRGFAAAATAALLGVCPGAADRPTVGRPSPPDASAERSRNVVLVYQLRRGRDPYDRRAYQASPRPAHGAEQVGRRLQVALGELVEGPTPAERRAGLTSAFSKDTAGILLRVELRGRRAVVDFRDFRSERPEWSTSYGGSIFLMQLSRTVFQFQRVRSAQFRIEGSCRRFWVFLEVVECEGVHRRR